MPFSFRRLTREGLHYLDTFVAGLTVNPILFFFQTILILVIGLSIMMMIISPYGPLYASLRLPLLWNIKLFSEDSQAKMQLLTGWVHPEQGTHWTTVLTYAAMSLWFLTILPKIGFKIIHTVTYSALVVGSALVFPFEWVYVPLLDIFHNFPVEHTMSTLFYGYWRPFPNIMLNSVIGRNGFLGFVLLGSAWIIAADNFAFRSAFKFFNFDRTSKLLLSGFLAGFAFWVLLPVIIPAVFNIATPYKGTNWFPQDILVWYAPTSLSPNELYDIVKEYWIPGGIIAQYGNGLTGCTYVNQYTCISSFNPPSSLYGPIMRTTNEIVKTLSVIWMAYTFTPRRKELKVN